MATNINNTLVCNEPHANLDSYYGPYESVEAAFNALADTTVNGVNYTKKYIGLTVGVWTNSSHNEIVEYWFKGGLTLNDLVVKSSDNGGGDLPEGVKIVTFDYNGGTGVQNPIVTDTNSQVILPECALTKRGLIFKSWDYDNQSKNPGDTITVGLSTVVKTMWGNPENYSVRWDNGDHITITGEDLTSESTISSGSFVTQGNIVKLTASVDSGYQFKNWVNVPSGGREDRNTLTFTVNSNISGVSAVAEAGSTVQTYTVRWEDGEGITITGIAGGYVITSGASVPQGTSVVLTATPDEGYQFQSWTNVPSGIVPTDNTLTFTVNANTPIISATAEAVTRYYTISWNNSTNVTITGKVNNTPIQPGESLAAGTYVTLTATVDNSDYEFSGWLNIPTGASYYNKNLSVTLNSNISGISALAEKKSVLPTGVKIVTFDYNGGTGAQNPIMSDTSSQVVLPQCTLTQQYSQFEHWDYNNESKNPGDIITIGSSTVVKAMWSGFQVTWTGVATEITGRATVDSKQVTFNSGQSFPSGTQIQLTAEPMPGMTFVGWTPESIPRGAQVSGNTLSFILNGNALNITATSHKAYSNN